MNEHENSNPYEPPRLHENDSSVEMYESPDKRAALEGIKRVLVKYRRKYVFLCINKGVLVFGGCVMAGFIFLAMIFSAFLNVFNGVELIAFAAFFSLIIIVITIAFALKMKVSTVLSSSYRCSFGGLRKDIALCAKIPSNTSEYIRRGKLLIMWKKYYDYAIEDLQLALETEPDNPEAHKMLEMIRKELEKSQK